MGPKKGLVSPRVSVILECLKARGWDPENLATHARLDVRTIVKVLAGKRVQYAKLEVIAEVFNRPVGDFIEEFSDNLRLPTNTSIRVYSNWDESWPTIESAQEEVVIIDSFVSEFIHLGTAISKSAHMRTRALRVSVYMASPNKTFGVQRVREKDLPKNAGDVDLYPLLDRQINKKEEDDYAANFRTFAVGILQHVGRDADVSVFEYVCMPSLRIIAVDHIHFYFGWFPIADQNPHHICLYLHDARLNETDAMLRDNLKSHIDRVKRLSAEVFPLGNRNGRDQVGRSA
jgi:hypothetical protein